MPATRAFRLKQKATFVNNWRLFRQQPIFKVGFIAIFAVACEIGLWLLFRDGFRYLQSIGGIANIITAKLFSLFFMGMGLMLVMSGIITAYATLFRSDEIAFLLVRPLPLSQLITYKYIESTHHSSWAFMFIIIPFVGAYAEHTQLSPAFALWTILFSIPFLFVCSGIGALIIMAFVRWYPSRLGAKPVILVGLMLLVLLTRQIVQHPIVSEEAQFSLAKLVPGLKLASNPLLPSTWIAEGILSLSRNHWDRGLLLWGLLSTSALVMAMAVEGLGVLTFRTSWERLEIGGGASGKGIRAFVIIDRLLRFLPGDVRAILTKDIRTFFRDPMQWSQVLIFFGLLGMYFANLRTFEYDTYGPQWRNMVSFLNVFSVSAVLCSLGARFIYPQLSLEGHGFWLLGLSPTSMKRILFSKLFLAIAGTLLTSLLLIVLSTSMLRMDAVVRVVSLVLIASVSLGVCCLSTGLGALFLDLRQRNPAAIVGGFGGTVNLVISLSYMLATILPFGLIFHLHAGGHLGPSGLQRALIVGGAG
ncbi:MAG: hypothetical protein O3A51_02145 [Verrucomicrobia bacterium]|nr:hypothetical protein [Verrucomicrobiota bacterium]